MDPRTPLCERCGYVLQGLPVEEAGATCPECGDPISASGSSVRPGSPWQIQPGVGGLLRAWLGVAIGPRTLMRRLAVRPAADRWLGRTNRMAASLLISCAALPALWTGPDRLAAAGRWAVLLAGAYLVHAVLTWVEQLGIQFFGRRRRWRITRELAWAITAHAGPGWVVGAALFLAAQWAPGGRSLLGFTSDVYVLDLILGGRVYPLAPGAAWLAGMLLFEWWVYVGVRQCRYANVPLPGSR